MAERSEAKKARSEVSRQNMTYIYYRFEASLCAFSFAALSHFRGFQVDNLLVSLPAEVNSQNGILVPNPALGNA